MTRVSVGDVGAENEASATPRARDSHPVLTERTERVRYIAHLMASRRWVKGDTAEELAEAWGTTLSNTHHMSGEAGRFLTLLGDREEIMTMVRERTAAWLTEGGQDRVQAARLLVDTVGGFTAKSEVTIKEIAGLSDWQRTELAILELVQDDRASAFFEEARAAYLAGRAVVTEGIDAAHVDLALTDGSGGSITDGEDDGDG